MSIRVEFRPAAEADLTSARHWYRERSEMIERQFASEIIATLDAILEQPERFPTVHRNVRRAMTKRFPYAVFFVVHPSRSVVVLRILHQARHPREWERFSR